LKIAFKQCHEDAKLPEQNHSDQWTGDSGYDIYSCEGGVVPANGSAVIPTGISVGFVTPGYWFKIEARSGLSFKHGVLPHPGIIDNQYRGDTGVKLYNHSNEDYEVEKGDKIAQLVVYQLINSDVEWTETTDETTRGAKGFGSSGK
jgi:dUTP pyrophosphatase